MLIHCGTTAIGSGEPGGLGFKLGHARPIPNIDDVAADFPHLLLAPCKLSMTWQLLFGETHKLDLERYAEAHADFVLAALRA